MAILGRVRTRDPDPGHFGPDFDSGSGHGSAFTDPQSGCLPKEHGRRDFWTDFAFFTDSFDLNFYTLKRCALVGFEGGNCVFAVKSGLNQGIVGKAFFKLLSSFLHE